MNNKPNTLREKFFSKLASIRKQDKEKKRKHSLIKRVILLKTKG